MSDLGSLLREAVTGAPATPVDTSQIHTTRDNPAAKVPTDLDRLSLEEKFSQDTSSVPESNTETPESKPETSEPSTPSEHLELKVKGYKEPLKLPKNWEDPKVLEYLNKGARFDKKMQELAKQQKDLEQKLGSFQDYESKAELASRVENARKLMSEGFSKHALKMILGDNTDEFIGSLVDAELEYRNAAPEKRLQMDLDRQKQEELLARQRDADRIAKLEAQINARSEQVREAEFTGYLEDAKGRYDLSQWVEDADEASALNEMLNSVAMSDIIKLQKQREALGQENISQRDIRRAFATRAKVLLNHAESRSAKLADTKIAQQSQVAAKNAQAASSKNYGQTDQIEKWKKSGGRMSDLVDLLRMGR